MFVSRRSHTNKKPLTIGLACIIVAAAVIAILELSGATHIFHKKSVPLPASHIDTGSGASINNQKGEAKTSSTPGHTVPTTGGTKTDQGGNSTSSESLITPSGDFVSAHHVSLSTPLTSVCNTTPSASCVISFTSGGVTKSLSSETADFNGSAYWNQWTPASIGLTAGSWQIKATATLNGQSKSASDAMELVVSS